MAAAGARRGAFLIFALAAAAASISAAEAKAFAGEEAAMKCPLGAAKADFDLARFTGDWYVLTYEYPRKMDLHALSCVGLHYSLTSVDAVTTNFTFRFPAATGHFYHVPTISLVSEKERAVWETQFRGVELVSIVADTDYSNWAVLVQCHERGAGSGADSPLFLSTRVLSRTRSLSSAHWMEVQDAVEKADAGAPHRYKIDQSVCEDMDGGGADD